MMDAALFERASAGLQAWQEGDLAPLEACSIRMSSSVGGSRASGTATAATRCSVFYVVAARKRCREARLS